MTTNSTESSDERQRPQRPAELFTGSERPYDPEDLVKASGREPTPASIEWARRLIAEEGPGVIERYLP
ncbi:hypothetical protein [Streptomyces halobius]|uniref:Uncharacterized protein n=1 Tax=Streptomyces halobius TaxID=2879846 RepID=A0ABY4MIB0_9ACTN|nr:hypothetical protein [Streptomyces halobius]UQA96977.1 hypothetical protein K9S39_38475 [Streptomyces halobius]